MLYPIKNIEELEGLNELLSLQELVNEVRLQDKLGKQKLHDDMKKLQEPLFHAIENTSENLAKFFDRNFY